MKRSAKNTAIFLLVLLGLTACSRKPSVTYGGSKQPVAAHPETSVTTAQESVTTVPDIPEEEDVPDTVSDTRSYFDSLTICGEKIDMPLTPGNAPDRFRFESDGNDDRGYDMYSIYFDDTYIGVLSLYEDGSAQSIGLLVDADYTIGSFSEYDDIDLIEDVLGKPEQFQPGTKAYRFDDMRATFSAFRDRSGKHDHINLLTIVYGDFSDKTNREILQKDILEDIDGEVSFEYTDIADGIIIDGIQMPTFPFSEKILPAQFDIDEFVGGDSLLYKNERIADIEVTRGSVVYIGFYAEAMEKYNISVGGVTYDMSEEEIRAVLGRPNCTRSTPDRFIYILDEDKVVAVNLSGYKNTYYPTPEHTDSNYVSVGVCGRKKFNS